MSTALSTLPLLPLSIALWSSYALMLSIRSIRAARTWEEPTRQAAKYSGFVAGELRKTRTTEGVGAVVTTLSLTTAFLLCLPSHLLPLPTNTTTTTTGTSYTPLAIALLNALLSYGARAHIQGFWRGRAKVPMMEQYNAAVETAGQLGRALGWMSLAWGMEGVGRGIEALGAG